MLVRVRLHLLQRRQPDGQVCGWRGARAARPVSQREPLEGASRAEGAVHTAAGTGHPPVKPRGRGRILAVLRSSAGEPGTGVNRLSTALRHQHPAHLGASETKHTLFPKFLFYNKYYFLISFLISWRKIELIVLSGTVK